MHAQRASHAQQHTQSDTLDIYPFELVERKLLRGDGRKAWSFEVIHGSRWSGRDLSGLPFTYMCAAVDVEHLPGYLPCLGQIEHSVNDILDIRYLS